MTDAAQTPQRHLHSIPPEPQSLTELQTQEALTKCVRLMAYCKTHQALIDVRLDDLFAEIYAGGAA